MENEKKSGMVLVAGLWKSKTKDGRSMLSGNLGAGRLVILGNKKKEKDTQPDFYLFIAEQGEKKDKTGNEKKPPQGEGFGDAEWNEEEPF